MLSTGTCRELRLSGKPNIQGPDLGAHGAARSAEFLRISAGLWTSILMGASMPVPQLPQAHLPEFTSLDTVQRLLFFSVA